MNRNKKEAKIRKRTDGGIQKIKRDEEIRLRRGEGDKRKVEDAKGEEGREI